jgi:transposase-like protein
VELRKPTPSAGRHERTTDRLNYRNGYCDRSLETRLGSLSLRIPKLRQGRYFPTSLEPRKAAEKALVTVIQEAWIGVVSTRRVDELVQAMGLSGISKSQVSKLCKDIEERVGAFLDRPLDGEWPYLWLDATYPKVRDGGRIVSVAPGRRNGAAANADNRLLAGSAEDDGGPGRAGGLRASGHRRRSCGHCA